MGHETGNAGEVEAQKPKATSILKQTLSGGFGGMCLVAVGHPLDTIKVRLQTMQVVAGQAPLYTGALDCAKKTIAREGVKGLYRGMAAPLIGVTPMYALCFFGYGVGQSLQRTSPDEKLSLFKIWNAGCLSGVFSTAIMVPLERVKCLLQVQTAENKKYNGLWDCGRGVYREEGIRGLYRGTAATALRDVPGSGAYFVAYEFFKRAMSKEGEPLNPAKTLFAGGMAGVFNWLVALPADVVKSRLQTSPEGTYRGLAHCFSDLVQKEGYGALYKGIRPVMLRAFPANAACFLGVEVSLRFLNWVAPGL
eukprot:TRINITY_DN3906_c0_g2_i1.p1 TRINITY_DN3906_c0_g2~~TRINITY_DN3906_c0_g2_i1.p1  ORF type:complete len:307 (+),score=93.36 TRINITY_DN3906_c0_g2_i1:96-1016(+)